jgi:CRP/FNR family cyclic AMP-dependent transcriptional regulator
MMRNDPAAKDFAAGDTIFVQGEAGAHAFVVTEGDVELELHGRVLETVHAGGIFGEMALIDRHERSATARAKTDAKIVPIDQKRFLYLVQNTPFFAIEVMKIMADRLRRMDANV